MNHKKVLSAALVAAAGLLCASSAHAQANVYMVGIGSSALYPSITLAEVTNDPITSAAAPCSGASGGGVWTGKNGSGSPAVVAAGNDPRTGGPVAEPGSISVVWNNAAATAGNPIPANSGAVICVFLSVDSIVGQRLYYAQGPSGTGNGTLSFNDNGNVGQKKVAGINDSTTTVPPGVTAAINGLHFTHAYTDIRPEDGQYAVSRAAAAQPPPYAPGPFGYDPSSLVVGTRVYSSFSNTFAQVSPYNIAGNDPFSGQPVLVSSTIPIGAAPVLVLVNDNISLGNATNILSKTAAKVFSGQIGNPQAIFGSTVVPSANLGISQIQREPLSGTYNTFEFQVVHARDGSTDDTMERSTVAPSGSGLIDPTPTTSGCPGGGLTPPVAFTTGQLGCTNPVFINSQNNSIRYRAIGTGEMINAVQNNLGTENTLVIGNFLGDNIGFAFYSFGGEWSPAKNDLKYLQLQGVDALYANYGSSGWATSGHFPTCTGAILPAPSTLQCPGLLPTFSNILNGSYRAWIVQRAIVPTAPAYAATTALVETVITQAQDQSAYALKNPVASGSSITYIADWVPIPNSNNSVAAYAPFTLGLFRSHYPLTLAAGTFNPNNATVTSYCTSDQIAAGFTAPCPEDGGDMAGVAYQIRTDQLYNQYYGGSNFLFTQVE
jgi:hypothetical protein